MSLPASPEHLQWCNQDTKQNKKRRSAHHKVCIRGGAIHLIGGLPMNCQQHTGCSTRDDWPTHHGWQAWMMDRRCGHDSGGGAFLRLEATTQKCTKCAQTFTIMCHRVCVFSAKLRNLAWSTHSTYNISEATMHKRCKHICPTKWLQGGGSALADIFGQSGYLT